MIDGLMDVWTDNCWVTDLLSLRQHVIECGNLNLFVKYNVYATRGGESGGLFNLLWFVNFARRYFACLQNFDVAIREWVRRDHMDMQSTPILCNANCS